jgi:RNA polymerase sigma factor (sigma-70 family)
MMLTHRDQSAAEDLVQEAYLPAFLNWSKFNIANGEDASERARAWMCRIVTNVFLSECRAAKVKRLALEDYVAEPREDVGQPDLCEREERRARARVLREALGHLPRAQAEAIERMDLLGESSDVAGAEIGIDPRNARKRKHRGLRALRELLEERAS